MLRFLVLAAAAAALSCATTRVPSTPTSPTPEERAVLAPFQAVLDGIAQRNKDLIRAQLVPGGFAVRPKDGQIRQVPFETFVEGLPSTGTERLEERIYEPLVRIDDDIAVIWARYEFFVDGKVHHCGTDIATLVRQNGRWLISGIVDNSRKNCPAQR